MWLLRHYGKFIFELLIGSQFLGHQKCFHIWGVINVSVDHNKWPLYRWSIYLLCNLSQCTEEIRPAVFRPQLLAPVSGLLRCNYLSMLRLKLIHVSKRGHSRCPQVFARAFRDVLKILPPQTSTPCSALAESTPPPAAEDRPGPLPPGPLPCLDLAEFPWTLVHLT